MIMEPSKEDWITVQCIVCGYEHLNDPEVDLPMCDECFDEFYAGED